MRYFFLFLLIGPISGIAFTQEISVDSIRFHGKQLIRNHSLEERVKSFNYLNENVGLWLQQSHIVPETEGMAILHEPNSGMIVVTYELYRDTSTYEYGGWLYHLDWEAPVFLNDQSADFEDDEDLDFMIFSPDYWYGLLYYQIVPLTRHGDRNIYLLFGLDNYHLFTKRKVLETLVIEDGKISFGAPVIEMDADLPAEYRKNRFIIDYSVQAPAALRYDTDHDKIIFDHLVYMPSNYKAQKVMKVPDGTYSGFELLPGQEKIQFVEKVFHEVMDEAPGGREKPKVKLNIIGEPMD